MITTEKVRFSQITAVVVGSIVRDQPDRLHSCGIGAAGANSRPNG